jgi:hypothetical protein
MRHLSAALHQRATAGRTDVHPVLRPLCIVFDGGQGEGEAERQTHPGAQGAGIGEVSSTRRPDGTVTTKVWLHNKLPALHDLGLHTGVIKGARVLAMAYRVAWGRYGCCSRS